MKYILEDLNGIQILIVQDSIFIVWEISSIMVPLTFPETNLQQGSFGCYVCCWSIDIWCGDILSCTRFVEIYIRWETIVLFPVGLWLRTEFSVVSEGPKFVPIYVHILLSQLSMFTTKSILMKGGVQSFAHVKINSLSKNWRETSQKLLYLDLLILYVRYMNQHI